MRIQYSPWVLRMKSAHNNASWLILWFEYITAQTTLNLVTRKKEKDYNGYPHSSPSIIILSRDDTWDCFLSPNLASFEKRSMLQMIQKLKISMFYHLICSYALTHGRHKSTRDAHFAVAIGFLTNAARIFLKEENVLVWKIFDKMLVEKWWVKRPWLPGVQHNERKS